MGLCKLFQPNKKEFGYLQYAIDADKWEGSVFVNDFQFNLNICKDEENIGKWCKNLNVTADIYWSDLTYTLEKVSAGDEHNQFVFDCEYIIWKTIFHSKNLCGIRGKFKLNKNCIPDLLSTVFNSLVKELQTKNAIITKVTSANELLTREKDEATKLAEEAVDMKVKFEQNIYAKFAKVLNAKKKQLYSNEENANDSIYEEDTDIDEDNIERPGPSKKIRDDKFCMDPDHSFNLSQSQDLIIKTLEDDIQMDFSY